MRMRATQATVPGKVVQKMHMIVSRCPFTLLMGLVVVGHRDLFLSVHVWLCRGWHCVERHFCILLKGDGSVSRQKGELAFLRRRSKTLTPPQNITVLRCTDMSFTVSYTFSYVCPSFRPAQNFQCLRRASPPVRMNGGLSAPLLRPRTMSQPLTFENGQRGNRLHCVLISAREGRERERLPNVCNNAYNHFHV